MLWNFEAFLFWNGQGDLLTIFFCSFGVLTLDTSFLDQLFLGVEENIKHSAGLTKGCVTQRKTF